MKRLTVWLEQVLNVGTMELQKAVSALGMLAIGVWRHGLATSLPCASSQGQSVPPRAWITTVSPSSCQ